MAKTIEASEATPVTPSIDPAEVAKFSAMAADWWNPNGKFKPLHRFNPVRLKFIRETAERHLGLKAGALKPLDGLRLLDIGCGGGLVCEPMARLGASVMEVRAPDCARAPRRRSPLPPRRPASGTRAAFAHAPRLRANP